MIEKAFNHTSGFAKVIGDTIEWHNQSEILLSFDINQVLVVGEYTNSSGPWFDDWFLVFVTRDGNWFEISCYCENIDDVTQFLSRKLDSTLARCRLANSAGWESIVSYPKPLAGKSMFQVNPGMKSHVPRTFWERVKFACGLRDFNRSQEVSLSDHVKLFVETASR
ncbi:MAG: hypothetical protein EOP48_02180 [Sphingobacteriales bacterium]|nr:MAG: hypothetical protein EOP48_02180 [Sphingobacteriales bacterium]